MSTRTPSFGKGQIPPPGHERMSTHVDNLARLVEDPELRYEKEYGYHSSATNHRTALMEAAQQMVLSHKHPKVRSIANFEITTRKTITEDGETHTVYAKYQPSQQEA